MNTDAWRGRRVLVTGHTGFKGAWLTLCLRRLGARTVGVALPPEQPEGIWSALEPWRDVDHRIADIRDAEALEALVASLAPEVVFHLAAQPIVLRSYSEPGTTFGVNVTGTVNLLEAVRRCPRVEAVVVVTSDKVYRQPGPGRPFLEGDELGGHDPYSASKACCELVVRSYRESGLCDFPIVAARAGNVIGGGDFAAHRIVPDLVRAWRQGVALPVRHLDATRPWQHVLDPLAGYLAYAERLLDADGTTASALNFGPAPDDGARTVKELVEGMHERLGGGSWEPVPGGSPPEAPTLELDASRARETLGWRPRLDFETTLDLTADWYRAQREGDDLSVLSIRQVTDFEERAGGRP